MPQPIAQPTSAASASDPDRSPAGARTWRSGPSRAVAVGAAAAVSAIALADAVVNGVTGQALVDEDDAPVAVVVAIVHGLAYAVFCWLLIGRAAQIDAGSRGRRWVRRLLVVDLGLLSAIFLFAVPVLIATGRETDAGIVGPLSGIAFLGLFVAAFALGVATRRRADLRPAPLLLLAVVPVIGSTIALGALGSAFAHPGYAEALVNFGIALLAGRVGGTRSR